MKDKEVFDKLNKIQEGYVIYNILFRTGGIAIQFFNPPHNIEMNRYHSENWKQYLYIDKYYPTLEDAITGEYNRLFPEDK